MVIVVYYGCTTSEQQKISEKWVRVWKCIQGSCLISSCPFHRSHSQIGHPFWLSFLPPSHALASATKLSASLHGLSADHRPFPLSLDFSCQHVYFCSFVEHLVRLIAPTNTSQVQVQCGQKDLGVSPATVCSAAWSLRYFYFGSRMSLMGSGFTCCFIQILNNCWWWKDFFVVTVIVRKFVTKKVIYSFLPNSVTFILRLSFFNNFLSFLSGIEVSKPDTNIDAQHLESRELIWNVLTISLTLLHTSKQLILKKEKKKEKDN